MRNKGFVNHLNMIVNERYFSTQRILRFHIERKKLFEFLANSFYVLAVKKQ